MINFYAFFWRAAKQAFVISHENQMNQNLCKSVSKRCKSLPKQLLGPVQMFSCCCTKARSVKFRLTEETRCVC